MLGVVVGVATMHTERVRQQELEWEGGEVTNANVVATSLCLCSSTFCGSLVQICIVHFVFLRNLVVLLHQYIMVKRMMRRD